MKKWLIVSDYPEKTGIWNYALDLYDSLKEDLDIEFLNLYNSKTFSSYPKIGKVLDIWNFYLWFFLWISGRKLKKYLNENNYDFIILAHQWMGYLLPTISKLEIEKITVLHDLMSYNVYKNNLLHMVFRFFAIRNIVKSDKIIFISDMTKKDFLNLGFYFKWKTKIINNYIRDDKFYIIKDKNYIFEKFNIRNYYNNIMLSVTNWQPHKNDITFLKLALKMKDTLFIKVWWLWKNTIKFINKNNIGNIQFFNSLDYNSLRELYNITDIYINTSTKEWFWYPPYEALFCGSKLLTTKSIDVKTMNWIYVLKGFYDISEYIKWINILLNQNLEFSNIDEYRVLKFKKKFIDFINKK